MNITIDMTKFFLLINLYVFMYEIVNYVIFFKKDKIRNFLIEQKMSSITTILLISIQNVILYFVLFSNFLKIIGIKDLLLLTIFTSLVDNINHYNMFSYMLLNFRYLFFINRLIFKIMIYKEMLQMNVIYGIILYSYILYVSNFIRINYSIFDDFFEKKIKTLIFTDKIEYKNTGQKARENIYSK
jgi:hypothetical protein